VFFLHAFAFRTLLEAHWSRGYTLLREELELSGNNEIKLVARLAFGDSTAKPQRKKTKMAL
jgi:hypothetical protein